MFKVFVLNRLILKPSKKHLFRVKPPFPSIFSSISSSVRASNDAHVV